MPSFPLLPKLVIRGRDRVIGLNSTHGGSTARAELMGEGGENRNDGVCHLRHWHYRGYRWEISFFYMRSSSVFLSILGIESLFMSKR